MLASAEEDAELQRCRLPGAADGGAEGMLNKLARVRMQKLDY